MTIKKDLQIVAGIIMSTNKKELVKIRDMIIFREEQLTKELKRKLKVGDNVTVHSNKVNESGIIKEIKRTKAIVEIDGKRWNCPISMITINNENNG